MHAVGMYNIVISVHSIDVKQTAISLQCFETGMNDKRPRD